MDFHKFFLKAEEGVHHLSATVGIDTHVAKGEGVTNFIMHVLVTVARGDQRGDSSIT